MLDRRCLFLLILFSANIAQAGQPAPKPQQLFASYWTSEPGWDTELQLKNNLASGSLTVTPVLRLSSALEISLDPVTIAPNDSVSVWVNLGLLKHSPDLLSQPGSYGSVVFRFGSVDARNVFASSVARLRGGPIEFYNEAHPLADFTAWPRAAGPGSQEGIWSQPRLSGSDFLILRSSEASAFVNTCRLPITNRRKSASDHFWLADQPSGFGTHPLRCVRAIIARIDGAYLGHQTRAVRDRIASRSGRYGRGVPRTRHAAWA